MNTPLFQIEPSGWVHLCPRGEYPVNHPCAGADGRQTVKRLVQVLDDRALISIVQEFAAAVAAGGDAFPGVLIDFDHFSEDTDKPSTAAGWLLDVRLEGSDLVGFIRWTDEGLAAVQGGRFRFLSPTWLPSDCEDLGVDRIRPLRLSGAGLTNKPNIPDMRPICNRQQLTPAQLKAMFAKEGVSKASSDSTRRPITVPSPNQPKIRDNSATAHPMERMPIILPPGQTMPKLPPETLVPQGSASRKLDLVASALKDVSDKGRSVQPTGPIQAVGPVGAPAGQRAVLPIAPIKAVGPSGAPAGQRAVTPRAGTASRIVPAPLRKLIGNRIFMAMLNRAMSDEQRKAMFARMGSGGGGPSAPKDDIANYDRIAGRTPPSPANGAPAASPGPSDTPTELASHTPANEPTAPATPTAGAPGGARASEYDAAGRKAAKQKEIDGLLATLPPRPVPTASGTIQNLQELEASLKKAGVGPAQRGAAINAARAANAVASRIQRDMYAKALKASGGNRLKAEVAVQKELAAQGKADARALAAWNKESASIAKKVAALNGDILEIDAKAAEVAAKAGNKADDGAAKAKVAQWKADIAAQVAKDKEAARARVAAEKAAAAAGKVPKPVDQAAAYRADISKRGTFWDAIMRGDTAAAQKIYPTADVTRAVAGAAAARKGAGVKDQAARIKQLRLLNPVE